MVALLIAGSVLAGMFAGWYGRKVYARIEVWGRKMNEEDSIFCNLTEPEARAASELMYRTAQTNAAATVHSHLPLGAASL